MRALFCTSVRIRTRASPQGVVAREKICSDAAVIAWLGVESNKGFSLLSTGKTESAHNEIQKAIVIMKTAGKEKLITANNRYASQAHANGKGDPAAEIMSPSSCKVLFTCRGTFTHHQISPSQLPAHKLCHHVQPTQFSEFIYPIGRCKGHLCNCFPYYKCCHQSWRAERLPIL